MHLAVEELLQYTDEERQRWEEWFRQNGEELLKVPIRSDRESTIGALILHIFGPELRHVQRLNGEVLMEYRNRPSDHIAELFGFGIESRKALRRFVARTQPEDWARTIEIEIGGEHYQATLRKVVLHVLIHEIRHWAQVSRLMRERGFVPPGNHDLLNSGSLT